MRAHRISFAPILLIALAVHATAQSPGEALFSRHCAFCHGANAQGGERGPDITARNLAGRTDLGEIIRVGLPDKGMPASPSLTAPEVASLVAHLRSLAAAAIPTGPVAAPFDAQAPPRAGDWPTYNGNWGGNRHSELAQIDKSNVERLTPAWLFSLPGTPHLQVTPVVSGGVMYVTAPNQAYALNPGDGRLLWTFRRPRSKGLVGDAAGGINRGVAILGQRLFMVTDNAHLLALDRASGRLLWDIAMADSAQNYGATSAPLIAGGLVISGHSGGDEGVRGFLAAYRPETGERVWRFWTVPAPGEPGSETWRGKDWEHGCATTWLTGSYDPDLNLLFWPTGNPCPDYNGDERLGDNLYSNTLLALDPATGKLAWHYQFTPHDLHDWDATQTPVVIDRNGRKLIAQANRNGYLYLLNRENGQRLYREPMVKMLSGLTEAPTAEGVKTCPAVEGATNWFSPAYHPGTGLFYVQTLEKCSIYKKRTEVWKAGQSYYGGSTSTPPGEKPQKYLRAFELDTGKLRWELPQAGPANSWGGVLSTAGGLVFFGHDNGDFAASDAESGKLLWRFPANQTWKASPMTYLHDGRQYVAIASGPGLVVFALK